MTKSISRLRFIFTTAVVALLLPLALTAADGSQFRGPGGSSVSDAKGTPLK